MTSLRRHRKMPCHVRGVFCRRQVSTIGANYGNRQRRPDQVRLEKHYRGVMANIGERSGCVVTTPIGITGSLSTSVTRNAPIIFASASVASTSAKCAPMQTRAPTPNGKDAKRSGGGEGAMKRGGVEAVGCR